MRAFFKSWALLLALAMFSAPALAQAGLSNRDKKAIARVRNTLTSQLEAGMPKITLEYFLKHEAGADAKLTWEVNDCGEQTGDPTVDSHRDIPICVEADATTADGREISVMVAIGSINTGINAKPVLFSIFVSGSRGTVSRLSQIPVELHRDFPKRPVPRDLPAFPSTPGAR